MGSSPMISAGRVDEVIAELPDDALLVHSRSALRTLGILPDARFVAASQENMTRDYIDSLLSTVEYRPSLIVSFGGGRATDMAKYAAFREGARLVSIPSLLSTNAFFTNKACLIEAGSKVTFDAKAPDNVVVDLTFLESCPRADNLAGLGELWSFHTALFDWQLAASAGHEPIDQSLHDRCLGVLEYVLDHGDFVYGRGMQGLGVLLRLLAFTGSITSLYGSGRPESGSEHLFAKMLEETANVVHGTAVALGVLLMSRLQGNEEPRIVRELRRSGQHLAVQAVPREAVLQCLCELAPRHDRYTVLDARDLSAPHMTRLLERVEDDHGLCFA